MMCYLCGIMKGIGLIILIAIGAKECKETSAEYASLPNARKILEVVKNDAKSLDSARIQWASDFTKAFSKEYKNYSPGILYLDSLRQYYLNTEIRIVGGNWCEDTQRELPRLAKILDLSGYSADHLYYYLVDKNKKVYHPASAVNITVTLVPTIFVYRNGKECGKIIERPTGKLEQQLLQILKSCQ